MEGTYAPAPSERGLIQCAYCPSQGRPVVALWSQKCQKIVCQSSIGVSLYLVNNKAEGNMGTMLSGSVQREACGHTGLTTASAFPAVEECTGHL